MGYRIVRKPSRAYIVRSGANYYAESDTTLQNSLGTTEQDYYGALVNTVYGLIYIENDTYLVATTDLEMVGDVSDYNQIQSMDDITPTRYGYGDQNGYVKGIGNELEGSYENGIFTISSGRVVVQGVEIDIDANGMSTILDIPPLDVTWAYKIYLEVNFNRSINLYEVNLKSSYSTQYKDGQTITGKYVVIPNSGELRNNETAYLELYWGYIEPFESQSIGYHERNSWHKTVQPIVQYTKRRLKTSFLPAKNITVGDEQSTVFLATYPYKEGAIYEIHGAILGGYGDEGSSEHLFFTTILPTKFANPDTEAKTSQILRLSFDSSSVHYYDVRIGYRRTSGDYIDIYGQSLERYFFWDTHTSNINTSNAVHILDIYEIVG